jgi:hypothetical protein
MSWVNGVWEDDMAGDLSMFPTNFQGFGKEEAAVGQKPIDFRMPPGMLGSQGNQRFQYFGKDRNRRAGDLGANTGIDWGGTLGGIGDVMSGVGNLGQAYAALGQLGVARKGLEQKRQGWNANYAAQATTTNNPIRMQQAMLRSDFYADPERAKQLKLVQPATLSG